jgi:CBS domain-containing protein
MDGKDKAADYMVKNVVTASLWQPLSFVRQQMLVNSFSFLPVLDDAGEPTGHLIADCSLACYLGTSRKVRLSHTLRDAVKSGGLVLLETTSCRSGDKVQRILDDVKMKDQRLPVLVVDEQEGRKHLIGILTAFDLL